MAVDPRLELARDIGAMAYDPLKHCLYAFPWDTPHTPLEGVTGPRKWQGDVMATIRNHLKDPGTRFTPLQIAIASGHGIGKALAHGEPVLTPLGWRPIESIQVDDEVIAADGAATKVRAVYRQGERELFRVTLDDGCSVVADGDHQWLTHSRGERKRFKPASIRTTREIAASLTFANGPRTGLNHQMPSLLAVQHPEALLPIEPYLFGCWLGDGDAVGRITGMEESFQQLAIAGAAMGAPVTREGSAALCRTMLGMSKELRVLGMYGCRSHEKHIPRCYLHGSRAQRTALLQGLLDTDGSANGHGAVTFEITAPRLADDTAELVRSLGGVVRRSEKMGAYGGKVCRRVYRLFLALPRDVQPFRVQRKLNRYNPRWGSRNCDRTRRRHIASVVGLGRGEATCIAVEHPSHLFVTRDHIVTHNSAEIGMLSKWALDCWVDSRVVITANTEQQLITKTSPEVQKWHKMAITRDWFKPATMKINSKEEGHADSWRLDFVTWSEHNTEAFAGLHNVGRLILIVYDEGSNISDKVWEVTEGALTDENTVIIWLVFGNPTRNVGRFRECFARYRHKWVTKQIDARTVEGTNVEYLNSIIDTYGEDSDIAKVRVLGQFPSASSLQFIGSGVAQAARERTIDHGAILPSDPVVFGLDHARFGDDSSVLAIRQGRDAKSRPWQRWNGANAMQIAGDLNEAMRLHLPDAVFIDAGGPNAGGVIDRLRQLNPEYDGIFEINFGSATKEMSARWNSEVRVRVANKRAQMWTNMRAWLDRGSIPDEQQIADDLIGVEYGYTADNAILLEKKEHMKARGLSSPDNGDALALTFAEDVQPRRLPEYLNPENYQRDQAYDRYEELPAYSGGKGYDRYSEIT